MQSSGGSHSCAGGREKQQGSWGQSDRRQRRLDVYIYDYFMKRNLQATAKAFQAEGKVSLDPVASDAPGGFLFEWWSIFWDIFIARTNEKHSDVAASCIELSIHHKQVIPL
uniref:Uncharacterized protein n=1 Tax=Oryza meridionalis TaxID=40149 RepID=A0A0E0C4R1_9ORYZ